MTKKSTVIFSVILIIAALGCEPQVNLYNLPLSLGTLKARINGVPWEETFKYGYQTVYCTTYTPLTCHDSYIYMESVLHDKELIGRQTLLFTYLPRKTGVFKVYPYVYSNIPKSCESSENITAQLSTRHDDQYNETFNTLVSDKNYVNIEKYDEETGEIKGSFEIIMVIENKGYKRTLPDTIHITGGRFHTKIIARR